jgi:hypothetical protein
MISVYNKYLNCVPSKSTHCITGCGCELMLLSKWTGVSRIRYAASSRPILSSASRLFIFSSLTKYDLKIKVESLKTGRSWWPSVTLHGPNTPVFSMLYPCGMGAQGDPYTATVSDLLCAPSHFVVIPDPSTRALR